MKDGEIYKLIKEQLLDLTRGIRKSEAGEVQYLKDLLKYFKNNK